jgi:uncharacterized membrane protein YeaQ/YmgE (transglycosylase-associated protein family)
MLAYIVVGLIMGAVAWQLKHESGDPRPATQMLVGVGGALLGGLVFNLLLDKGLMAMDPWGFVSAVVMALVLLGLLQAKVG